MHAILSLSALMAFALPVMSHPVNQGLGLDLTSPNPAHVKRQRGQQWGFVPPCEYTKLVGEKKGDLVHHWQVSKNLECHDGECAVAEIEQHTFGVEASVGIGANVFGAGLGLVSEWTSGSSYECSGQAGETICVWAKAEYALWDVAANPQPCSPPEGEGRIIEAKIPKESGEGMYCVRGPCRDEDQHYWQTL
ncbi:MAG: hypothetical protein Q9208_004992 [Pyrenodesmia sp. 3 TL-2023]